jgi:hypothetical protein
MTIFGFSGWFLGEPSLFKWQDVMDLAARMIFTGGFLLMGLITLVKQKRANEFGHLIISSFMMGLILAVASTAAFFKAATNKPLPWHCTPKAQNSSMIK